MDMPKNHFKQAMKANQLQIGLWLGLGETFSSEICAGAGFDWLLIDAEHGPNDLRSILAQLQAIAPYASQPVVRPPLGDHVLIKQLLETGIQTLLIPMVETAEQARMLVQAMRYPPYGIRGVGSALARASRWGRVGNYMQEADEQMCLLVQVETRTGMENLDEILEIECIDGIFFGAADLAASYGFKGESNHPEIVERILDGLAKVKSKGLGGGVLCNDKALNQRYMDAGANFVAVGVDALLLAKATSDLLGQYKSGVQVGAGSY
ncbi:2,4-dihydroxyhept-2-enedioate aldolase [Thiothrix nivea DSM 5205]|uniref:2,4-dihydroxyhept-2-enedioate aldolase n=2 Tax=Thiothrix nivea TaxID=1031 RepID=A0A656HJU6_THINJ|nr:2,4-dihydroxyhept-2-enedioate aldolase [Thiothrix nivea DSM 5205]